MGRNWGITIGINGYRYLQRLEFAQHDADAMRQLFGKDLEFEQVYHFTDNSPDIQQDYGPDLDSYPTATTLGRFLRTRFEQPFLQDGDNLWFFFAGHGIRYNNRDYLMPIDGDPGDLERSAIPIHYISERLRRSGADNVILLIDACRSFDGRRGAIGIGDEPQQGVITLFSCSPEESAYEIAELQQGAFTHVLLDSLRCRGEGNCATVERLYHRLRYYVPQLTQRYKHVGQTPYGVIEPPTKNHLIVLPRVATLADIMALKKEALSAEVEQDYQRAKQYWVRVLAVSPADPEAIEGIERLSCLHLPLAAPPRSPHRTTATPRSGGSRASDLNRPTTIATLTDGATESVALEAAIAPVSLALPTESSAVSLPNVIVVPLTQPPLPPLESCPLPASRSPQSPRRGLSRRQMIQLLGFSGGGLGVMWLGRTWPRSQEPLPPAENDTNTKTNVPATLSPASPVLSEWPELTPFEFEVVTVNETGQELSRETRQAQMVQTAIAGLPLELVAIPGGTFTMGSPASEGQRSPDEGPQRTVTVPAFLIGKYPVTQAQYQAVMGHNPSAFVDQSNHHPVEGIRWDDAMAFCKRLTKLTGHTYRLPTEAEWEYACRAGTTSAFSVGATLTPDLANYNSTTAYGAGASGRFRERTTKVGRFPANAFGVYDLHGNVWEWCLDYWHDSYDGAPTDGSAWRVDADESVRILRGGSWNAEPRQCRSAYRSGLAHDYGVNDLGLRVVCEWSRPETSS